MLDRGLQAACLPPSPPPLWGALGTSPLPFSKCPQYCIVHRIMEEEEIMGLMSYAGCLTPPPTPTLALRSPELSFSPPPHPRTSITGQASLNFSICRLLAWNPGQMESSSDSLSSHLYPLEHCLCFLLEVSDFGLRSI